MLTWFEMLDVSKLLLTRKGAPCHLQCLLSSSKLNTTGFTSARDRWPLQRQSPRISFWSLEHHPLPPVSHEISSSLICPTFVLSITLHAHLMCTSLKYYSNVHSTLFIPLVTTTIFANCSTHLLSITLHCLITYSTRITCNRTLHVHYSLHL